MARIERCRKQAFIVLPCGLASRGGVGQAVRNLLEGWRGREDAPSCRVIDSWHVEWRIRRSPISPLYFVWAIVLIVTARFRRRVGLLHLNMSQRGSVVRKGVLVWLGALLRVPVIVHIHAATLVDDLTCLPSFVKTFLRMTMERARFVIVLGRYWRDFFVDQIGVDPASVVIIPNGVRGPDDPATRAQAKSPRLLFLGQLGERKGTTELLQALADPRVRALDWTLVLAGDGEVESLYARAQSLGLAERCSFLGWIEHDQVTRLLSNSEVLVLPSHAEGLPVAILEAMAFGLAVVTTPVGASEDAITDRETGMLVPGGDVEALVGCLVELMSDADLCRSLGRAAQARYRQEFTLAIYADRIRELYRLCGLV
jgi:glycosyltransferase involved in cell wall biosynthesis